MQQDIEYENNETSKYNDAGLSIMRLNNHWIACEIFANSGKLIKWKYRLDTIWRELYPDVLRKEDADELIRSNLLLMKKISKYKNKNSLYFNLCRRHEWLRHVQDLAGKANVYVDDNMDAIE